MTPNFLDRLIGYFDPRAGERRLVSRQRMQTLSKFRAYEGASKTRRTAGWRTGSTSANAEIAQAGATLRDRSRDLVRNNAYASRGKTVVVNNTVGTGIIPKVVTDDETKSLLIQDKLNQWADTLKIDADGRLNLYGLQNQAIGATFESGEYLIRRIRRKADPAFPVPLQVQFLEADFLDTSKNGAASGGGAIFQGIEFNSVGQRVAYWIFDEHPGGSVSGKSPTSFRVPAEDVIHGFRVERPGQVRGVPWLAPVMIPLRDLDEMLDATLMGAKVAACFSVFIVEPEMPLTESSEDRAVRERVEPGMIELLPPGRDIKFAAPPAPSRYDDFCKTTLRRISAGVGVPYEALTGDLSSVNFSSGRMGWLEFQRSIEVWRWQMLAPQMLDRLAQWFIEAVRLELSISPDFPITLEWTAPRREMIDPSAEVASTRDAIRAGLKTFSEAVRELGADPAAHFAEYKRDLELLDSLELTLDSDPRKMSKVGFAQTPQALELLAGIEQPKEKENEVEGDE